MTRKPMTAAQKKAFAERMKKARAAKAGKPKTAPKTASKKRASTKGNPTSDTYVVKIEGKNGASGYLSDYLTTGNYTDSIGSALTGSKKAMDSIARLMQICRPLGLKSVEVVKKK